jgi:hypothetical protein
MTYLKMIHFMLMERKEGLTRRSSSREKRTTTTGGEPVEWEELLPGSEGLYYAQVQERDGKGKGSRPEKYLSRFWLFSQVE